MKEGVLMNLERLDALCADKGISKRTLEKEAGLSIGSTSKWKTNNPNQSSLQKVANYFGVSVDYLTGNSDEQISEAMIQNLIRRRESKYCEGLKVTKAVQIPVLGRVVAGIPIEAVEDVLDYEEIPEEWTYLGEFFALKIKGESMQPRIQEGDVVIVKKQPDAESGDLVIALVNGNEATCKKLVKHEDGISLVSFNPLYEPMYFSNKDIQEKPVLILGKVIENRQKF